MEPEPPFVKIALMSSLKERLSAKHYLPHIDLTKLVLLSAVLIVAFSVFYYLMIFIPEKERREEAEQTLRWTNLNACLTATSDDYMAMWNQFCKDLGLGEDCILPFNLSDRCDEHYKEHRDECFKLYPIK